jgi:GxxExxY protein
MINEKYAESALTGKIIGCCMEVHRELGSGFREVIYQKSLAIEFDNNNIKYSREHTMQVSYTGKHVGMGRVDFFVENKVMLELNQRTDSPIFITHRR